MKMGILEALLVVFIVLKLCNVITWAWIWVLSPLWLDLVFTTIVFVVIKVYHLIVDTFM